MATFVLVHGAFHGAWCWAKLLPELAKLGHRAIAPDMPGMGDDDTPADKISLDAYVARVGETLAGIDGQVVLVGHSLGTNTASQSADRWPDRIANLVFLAGSYPMDGHSLYSLGEIVSGRPSHPGLMPPAGHPFAATFQEPALNEARAHFYHDCSDEDVAYAFARLKRQHHAPRITPLSLSPERYGRLRKTFVACLEDRAMTPERRQFHIDRIGMENVRTLPTSHSPFFSAPRALAKLLDGLA